MSVLGTIGAVGAVAGAGIGAGGAVAAANTQAGAAENAQELQAQEAANALAFQEQEWNTTQANEAPFLKTGQNAINTLGTLLDQGTAGTGPLAPWTGTFTAPTVAQAEATPGYQFELGQGEQAISNSAAARGGLLSTGTAKNLDTFANNTAATNYQQAYNNALTSYQTAYNTFENNSANTYNRYANLAGFGQTSAGQLGQQGQAAAANTGNIFLTSGAQQGADIQAAGAANASGYASLGNLFGNASSSAIGGLTQMQILQQLLAAQNGGVPSANLNDLTDLGLTGAPSVNG